MATEQSTTQVFIRSDRANIVQYIIATTSDVSGTVTHRPVHIYPGLNVVDASDHKQLASQMANTTDISTTKPIHELPEREAISIVRGTTSRGALEVAAASEKRAGVRAAISSQVEELLKKAKK